MVMKIHEMEIRNEGKAEGVDEARLENIRNIMINLHFTPQQAMDALSIPPADQARYKTML